MWLNLFIYVAKNRFKAKKSVFRGKKIGLEDRQMDS